MPRFYFDAAKARDSLAKNQNPVKAKSDSINQAYYQQSLRDPTYRTEVIRHLVRLAFPSLSSGSSISASPTEPSTSDPPQKDSAP